MRTGSLGYLHFKSRLSIYIYACIRNRQIAARARDMKASFALKNVPVADCAVTDASKVQIPTPG